MIMLVVMVVMLALVMMVVMLALVLVPVMMKERGAGRCGGKRVIQVGLMNGSASFYCSRGREVADDAGHDGDGDDDDDDDDDDDGDGDGYGDGDNGDLDLKTGQP